MTTEYVRPEATATLTVTTPVVVVPGYDVTEYSYGFEDYAATSYPAQVVYTEGFETANDWSPATSNDRAARGAGSARTGTYKMEVRSVNAGAVGTANRLVTGLTVGRSYTFAVWTRYAGTGSNVNIGVQEIGTTVASAVTNSYVQKSYTFTATATSHTLVINATSDSFSSGAYFDDLTLTANAGTVVTNPGTDGWTGGANSSTTARTGTRSLYANSPARAFTGLVVGHQYSLSGWQSLDGGAWSKVQIDFNAASTSMSRTLSMPGVRYWDDVQLVHHVPAVTTTTPELKISEGKVRLDENYSPYVTANFTVPLTSLELLEQIDPRTPQRVSVQAVEGVSGLTRTYNLGIRSRTVNHRDQTIEVEAASDEILLHDRMNVSTTEDPTPRTYESSLRGVCNWALNKIGASLSPGTTDANVTARWTVTNEFTNPNPMSNAGYTTGAGTSAILYTTGFGRNVIRWTASATGVSYLNIASGFSVRPGYLYTIAGDLASSVSRNVGFMLRWMNAEGATIKDQVLPTVATTTTGWTRSLQTVTAPPTAQKVNVFIASNVNTAGQFHYVSQLLWAEGVQSIPYFDGSSLGGGYTYVWEGIAGSSPSTRKPADGIERLPDLFHWKPGQSLFEFLQPLLNVAGLRLFCDENRVWRLVNPSDYAVPGYVVAQAKHNTVEGSDTISRNTDEWADAVVVKYTWNDSNGQTRTAYDSAGDPTGKAIVRELNREYPGPGAAQAILNSYIGRGRVQNVTALGQYGATPGQDVTINLPGTLTQTGKVRAVTFDLRSGLMDLETRALTDALPGSWAVWNPSQTWAQVNNTLKWKDA